MLKRYRKPDNGNGVSVLCGRVRQGLIGHITFTQRLVKNEYVIWISAGNPSHAEEEVLARIKP